MSKSLIFLEKGQPIDYQEIIERELNIQIYDKEKDSCSTIEDLINLVENKLIAKKK